jgi:hypothetical protein
MNPMKKFLLIIVLVTFASLAVLSLLSSLRKSSGAESGNGTTVSGESTLESPPASAPSHISWIHHDSQGIDTNVEMKEATFYMGTIRKLKLKPEELARIVEQRDKQLKETIQKDVADGINSETRARESEIEALSENLQAGMSLQSVTNLLGMPDRIQSLMINGQTNFINVVDSFTQIPTNASLCISYWPRTGLPFDARNGQGYKVLYLQFDEHENLEQWVWQQPGSGSAGDMNTIAAQVQYWHGVYRISPPPPKGALDYIF